MMIRNGVRSRYIAVNETELYRRLNRNKNLPPMMFKRTETLMGPFSFFFFIYSIWNLVKNHLCMNA